MSFTLKISPLLSLLLQKDFQDGEYSIPPHPKFGFLLLSWPCSYVWARLSCFVSA